MTTWDTSHRNYDLPNAPWILRQTWQNVLFLHFQADRAALSNVLLRALDLDTYNGTSWVSILAFEVRNMHLRGLPPIPGLSAFAECNVRTYVVKDGIPGVYFFSLDAANSIAVLGARTVFHLPYYRASFRIDTDSNRRRYRLKRTHRHAPAASLDCSYQLSSPSVEPSAESIPGSLASWLTDRYALFTTHKGKLYQGDIHHEPWPLQEVQVSISTQTMLKPFALDCGHEPDVAH